MYCNLVYGNVVVLSEMQLIIKKKLTPLEKKSLANFTFIYDLFMIFMILCAILE